jgi:hypothetical protein
MVGQRQAYWYPMKPALDLQGGLRPDWCQYRQGQLVSARIAATRFEIGAQGWRSSARLPQLARGNDHPPVTISVLP